MLCKKLHHAAFRCRDARETVDFYTDVLGLKFTHAMGGDHVPSTGHYSPHLHIFLEMEDGSSIAFFECPQDPGEPSGRDVNTPGWIQHFAFQVADVDTLLAAKSNLEAKGIEVVGPINHGDFVMSIYLFDPSGHRLELAVQLGDDASRGKASEGAYQVLEAWEQTHDWSLVGKASLS